MEVEAFRVENRLEARARIAQPEQQEVRGRPPGHPFDVNVQWRRRAHTFDGFEPRQNAGIAQSGHELKLAEKILPELRRDSQR